jgi:hypothetical protein
MSKEITPVYKRLSHKNFIETPDSDTTRNINYSEKDKILEIEFRPNFIYQYLEVPAEVWKEYKKTIEDKGSSGKFIHKNQIKETYPYRKVLLNKFSEAK